MPTYQYTCTDCGEPLEVVQKFSDSPLTVCPACGGRLRKVFSAVGVVFKGSGFYRTDSRDSARSSVAGTSNGSSPDKKTPDAASSASSASANGSGGTSSSSSASSSTASSAPAAGAA